MSKAIELDETPTTVLQYRVDLLWEKLEEPVQPVVAEILAIERILTLREHL